MNTKRHYTSTTTAPTKHYMVMNESTEILGGYELVTAISITCPTQHNRHPSNKQSYVYGIAKNHNDISKWVVLGLDDSPVPFIDALEWNVGIKDKKHPALAAQLFTIANECDGTIDGMSYKVWLTLNHIQDGRLEL